jgi:hypothetical protein
MLYLIFYFLINRKLELRKTEKAVTRVRLALFIHILPSKQPKIRVGRGRETNVSCVTQNQKYISASMEHINNTYLTSRKGIYRESLSLPLFFVALTDRKYHLGEAEKMIFKATTDSGKSCFAFKLAKMTNLKRSEKLYFQGSHISSKYFSASSKNEK